MTITGEERGGAGRDGPWWWERPREAVLDVGLGAVSAVECAFEGVAFAREAGVPVVLGALFGIVVGAVLVLRRRWPIAVVLVGIAVSPAAMGFLLSVVGLYTLASSEVPRRITATLTSMSMVATFVVMYLRTREGAADEHTLVISLSVFVAVALSVPPVLFGLYIGARRRLMESLQERADSLERELSLLADRAEERAEWARTEERTRIAREMHDVVAHRVSLMVVHAAALQAVAAKDPVKAARNAALVGDMGRQALTELREMLGVLRAESPKPAVVAVAAVALAGSFEDGPSLAELDALVGQSRAAGMAVELDVRGGVASGDGYPPEVEQTAYRVVQEALTNCHKHAPGARVVVRLAHREGEVAMQVENGPCDGKAAEPGLPSGGNGLVGMRERVLGLGGVFVSGPTDEGGFRVSAVLPCAQP
ncbi:MULTISPECIES: sensor histidine kinase [unclassified Streptomyces]|uniref:sensor histidine kinase n=1 Tax=unclassified Streptomyces TaxID=2593676 RepID=UPI002257F7C9|nr:MULTISPECIES: histidine kinase [unclassified Streptomyces]MCX4526232.1 histidine kinase [Streptomyces sp. NBC_01551]MCX4543204.1 histidine kinase [Streptomyces sp. NBC_01565]